MTQYTNSTYGDKVADVYDQNWAGVPDDTEATAQFLAELCDAGAALELGIGTGRIALALARRGVKVCGIDSSEAILARIRAKPGGESIPVSIGDFADVDVNGKFHLVYIAFNAFFALLTQKEQVRCFRNVAERLETGGKFVLEVFVPAFSAYEHGQAISTELLDHGMVQLSATMLDSVNQRLSIQHIRITEAGVRLFPLEYRYAWPSELDLMAELAGLKLTERWSGWQREPFTARSAKHISVYTLL